MIFEGHVALINVAYLTHLFKLPILRVQRPCVVSGVHISSTLLECYLSWQNYLHCLLLFYEFFGIIGLFYNFFKKFQALQSSFDHVFTT